MKNRTTLELANGPVIYVRHHTSDIIPGPYEGTFILEKVGPGVWEAKVVESAMTLKQRRGFYREVMARDDISVVKWVRHIGGKIIHRETIFRSIQK